MLEDTCYNSIKLTDVKRYHLLLYYRVGEKPCNVRPITDFYFEPGFSIVFLERHYLISIRLQRDNREEREGQEKSVTWHWKAFAHPV